MSVKKSKKRREKKPSSRSKVSMTSAHACTGPVSPGLFLRLPDPRKRINTWTYTCVRVIILYYYNTLAPLVNLFTRRDGDT